MQAFVEGLGQGIPVNISSDPRNETRAWAEYNAGSGGKISLWPSPLGLAATFDPELVEKVRTDRIRRIPRLGYRHSAVAADRSGDRTPVEPVLRYLRRRPRSGHRYGAGLYRRIPDLRRSCRDCGRLGYESVNAMVKHWPGGGRKKADGMPISASGNTLFTPAEISSNTSGPLWKELSASTARHERPQPSCPIIRFPTGWTPREKRSATVLANISSPICCGTDTDTTASSARIGASRTTIPASRRLTANAGEWRP